MAGRRLVSRLGFIWLLVVLAIVATCSKDNNPTNPSGSDVAPPAVVTDLVVVDPAMSSLALQWTAPGDDGTTGTAAQYDVRYSTSPITEANWASATQVSGEPSPKAAGQQERFVVTYLSAGVAYYFAVKTADEKPNWSALSNIASDTTLSMPDNTPPAAVTDLAAINPTEHTVTLTWTAPGDDGTTGTATLYDIRYSRVPISDADWLSAHYVTGVPSPKPAGSAETFEVTGLEASVRYYFAVKTADEKPNWSPVSNVVEGTTLAVTSGWSAMGSGMEGQAPYLPGVGALIVYNGNLVAGGSFIGAGGVPVNKLAVWNGDAWSDLGSGPGDTYIVGALAINNDQLIVGRIIGSGSSTLPLCSWDGYSWTTLPYLSGNSVFALTVYGGLLVAGGAFTRPSEVPANSVAAWNGSSWSALGSGFTPRPGSTVSIAGLGSYNGQLIAAGSFATAGGTPANGIAAWNGVSWSPLGSGVSNDPTGMVAVQALAVYDNKLIAGGHFTEAGGVTCNWIASWDGSSWLTLGSGMSDGAPQTYVSALCVYNNKLIAGGRFKKAGGVPCNSIAMWDGSSWSPLGSGVALGSGMDGAVTSLTVYNGRLIVGGVFASAGGYPAASIASWSE